MYCAEESKSFLKMEKWNTLAAKKPPFPNKEDSFEVLYVALQMIQTA